MLKNLADKVFRIVAPATEGLLQLAYHEGIARTSINKPIIVIGPERSGTSMIYALLANHPDVYALTTAEDQFPDHPLAVELARKILSFGAVKSYHAVPNTIGGIKGGRFPITEGNRYWARHLGSRKGMWPDVPDDSFTEEDLDETTRRTLPLDLKKRLTVLKRRRLVLKQPGFSLKIGYLNALFPDAIFVHCLRHPLDNFHSVMARKTEIGVSYWGLRVPGWQQLSHLSSEVQTAHQLADTWQIIRKSFQRIGKPAARYVPVRYEAFQTAFAEEVQKLFHGCELESPAGVLQNPENYVRPGKQGKQPKEPPTDPVARDILEKLAAEMGYASETTKAA